MLEDYTQSILMQLALARKDELFNGSIIASSSFYTGSFQGCNYFHTWFNTWHHWHIQYVHTLTHSCRHIRSLIDLGWHSIYHTILPDYSKWTKKRIGQHQVSSALAFAQNSQAADRDVAGLEIDGLTLDASAWGGKLCLPVVLQSCLAALY